MSETPPLPDVFPTVVKPLLREALGVPFLAYVLGATEEEIERWLISDDDAFGSFQQNQALKQLHIVLHAQGGTDPTVRRYNLPSILGIYQEPLRTTLVNVIRMMATNQVPTQSEQGSLEESLAVLARDMYPLYLLPDEGDRFFPRSAAAIYQHPMRQKFNSFIMDDGVLCKLFPSESEHQGTYGYALRSTGQGGSIQLEMLAETLIASGWSAAKMNTVAEPTLDEHIQATLAQLEIVGAALRGDPVEVPVRIAFTGVLLLSDEPLNLGWGVLRKADERDRQFIPRSIDGQLSGTGADGVSVTIDYGGNVVLDTTVDYRIRLKDFNPGDEWPRELKSHEQTARRVESIQLGALLSQEFNPQEPITVLSTWYYTHDPLSHGLNMSWSDPRLSRAFIPKQLDEAAALKWQEFATSVEQNRTKYIDVAIRRTLRAVAERKDFADVLVDSVIAWENLFGSRQGESTLRICGSLAWLLEEEVSKRAERRTELGKIYATRSDVVHGNKEHEPKDLVPQAHRALEIAIAALKVLFTTRLDLMQDFKTGDDRSNRLLMGG